MRIASLKARGVRKNSWFEQKSRDDYTYPFRVLREKFAEAGIALNSADLNHGKEISFELHADVFRSANSKLLYLLLLETPQICPNNRSPELLRRYRKIFTWDDSLVDGDRFVKLNMPNKPLTFPVLGFQGREKLCCLIAGNKNVRRPDVRELYSKRVETIRWFESHAKDDFDLYGIGWEYPPARIGFLGKLMFRALKPFYRLSSIRPFPSYRGPVESKYETLSHYKFAICYENVTGFQGYITEKIFDCFFAGCVPVYWGATNIGNHVPPECFIDRIKFSDHASLYSYLRNMDETEYTAYQQAIKTFLASEAAQLFYAEHFAAMVVNSILVDLAGSALATGQFIKDKLPTCSGTAS